MRWEDERYVRVYTRDTTDWVALGWEAQSLFLLTMRKVDRAGILDLGRSGVRGLAALVTMPLEVVERALPVLTADGCVVLNGQTLVIPNFIEAQEAKQSDAQRKRESRATARDLAAACVTNRDPPSRTVTGPDAPPAVASESVTPNCAVPSRTEITPTAAPAPRARLVSPFPEGRDPNPLTTAVLAALFDRGIDAAPPGAGSAPRVEAAIAAATLPVAVERLAPILANPEAKRPLTFHVDAIRGERPKPRTTGDLGCDLRPWHARLTPEERQEAQAQLHALAAVDPELDLAPLGIVGNPESPAYGALVDLNERWRAIAEARR
jgi:hypothetical protein